MKLNASASNSFPFTSPLPFVGDLGRGTVRRQPFRIKPFAMEEVLPTLAESDSLARRLEIVCAVVLGLSLLASVIISLTQLVPA